MKHTDLVNEVSERLGLPPIVVDKVYRAYWRFIRDTIKRLPLKDNIPEEDFLKLRTNFNIPSLGKLSCSYDRVRRVRERYEYIRDLRKKT